ncbi:MAG: Sun protein [Polyangiaceae bacterium]|nr:Sun protein [Polyangiaceae bacterium]
MATQGTPPRAGSESAGGRAPLPTARRIATRVLERVATDAAFASAALDAELERYPQLAGRDRALATELVYGCLRTGPALRARLAALAPRGIAGGDLEVRIALELGAYQLLFLDRVPPHAAVDEAVRAVAARRGRRVGGFVNAVLRRLAPVRGTVSLADAILESVPEWLVARLTAVIGADGTRALLGAEREAAHGLPLALRVSTGRELPRWLAEAAPGRVSPRARLVRGIGDPRRLSGYAEGTFTVQEEGAQAVALALGARPGERLLDACAGRGQKSSLLREQIGDRAELWAVDLYPGKLEALLEEHARLRLVPPRTAAVDWTVGAGPVPEAAFDRALVDAPCTGTGTLRRRPEIASRLGLDDPARLGALAAAILRRAATRVRPGGRVIFAVCSVLPEEGEFVVEAASDLLAPAPFDATELATTIPADVTAFRLHPAAHGTDGYFIASFVRR